MFFSIMDMYRKCQVLVSRTYHSRKSYSFGLSGCHTEISINSHRSRAIADVMTHCGIRIY